MFLFGLTRRRPILWIGSDNGLVMRRRRIVEINPHGRRSKQHVDRNMRRDWASYPGAAFEVNVLTTSIAVIDLIARVINVVIMDDNFTRHVNRRRRGVVSRTRTFHVANASGHGGRECGREDKSDF